MIVTEGATSVSVPFYFVDDVGGTNPGEPTTGLLFSDIETGGSASYQRQGAARVDFALITLASAAAAYASGGFILVDDTEMAGVYRCDIPDAAVAAGVDFVIIYLRAASAKNTLTRPLKIDLTTVDLREANGRVDVGSWLGTAPLGLNNQRVQVDVQAIDGLASAATVLGLWLAEGVQTVADSGTTTTLVDAVLTQADGYWKGALLVFRSGTNAGRTAIITDFDAPTDTLTFAPAVPDAVTTEGYVLVPGLGYADITAISQDATAADNLELQYDGTGLLGDAFPLRQDQGASISGGLSVRSNMTSVTVIQGSEQDLANTNASNDTRWTGDDDGAGAEFIFRCTPADITAAPGELHFEGYYDEPSGSSNGATLSVYNFQSATWDVHVLMTNSGSDETHEFSLAHENGAPGSGTLETVAYTIGDVLIKVEQDTQETGNACLLIDRMYVGFISAAVTAAEMADAVWDEPVAEHVAAGSFGKTDADILADTDNLQTSQGNWLTATGFSTHDAAAVYTAFGDGSNLTALATATGFSTHTAANVWAVDATGEQTQGTFGQAMGDPGATAKSLWQATVSDAAGVSVSADVIAVKTDTGNLVTRIPSALFSGITSLAQWLGILGGKQAGNATAQTEMRATGAGSGTIDPTTDSQEAIRDNTAWNTATGFSTHAATDIVSAGAIITLAGAVVNVDLVDVLTTYTGNTLQTGDSFARIGAAGASLSDLGGMSTGMKAEVLVEINTAIDTAIAELGVAAPTATPTLRTGMMLMYMALRNKTIVQTSGTDALEIYNDAGTKIASKLLTDDGADYSEAKLS